MFCSKCGAEIKSGTRFCAGCGAEVPANGNQTVVVDAPKKKSYAWVIILVVVLLGIPLLIGIGFGTYMVLKSSNKTHTGIVSVNEDYSLVCTSKEGNITLNYNDDRIYSYDAENITYDMDAQNTLFEKYGREYYQDEFNDWFEENTSGSCIAKDSKGNVVKDYSKNNSNKNNTKKTNPGMDTTKTKVVGEPLYGYVDVPTDWTNFKDINGGHSIQFSYLTKYIVTLDYVDPNQQGVTLDAKKLASTLMTTSQDDENIEGVTGATVTIGKDKKYTAYQVYMYYKSEDIYLVTYWFDGEDGYIHYVAIEGPQGVEDLLSIPESFRLEK